MRFALAAVLAALSAPFVASTAIQPSTFNPYQYRLSNAICPAVDHATGIPGFVNIQYLSVNPKANKTLLLVHGWPALWTIWGPQILEFSKDYHLIVPNLRGHGLSTFYGNVKTTGTFFDIASDLNCLMNVEKVAKATCVGHDWGSQVCLETAIFYPDRILAASGTIPYQPNAGDYVPVWLFAAVVPQLGYQVYFNNFTDNATRELNKDIRRSLRSTYKTDTDPLPSTYLLSQTDYLGCWGNATIPLSTELMNTQQENYMVETFSIQGFHNTLYFYQNADRVLDHNFTIARGGALVRQPVLFLPPAADGVVKDFNLFMETLGAWQFVPNSQTVILANSGHWVTLEVPDAYNAALRSWLESVVYV